MAEKINYQNGQAKFSIWNRGFTLGDAAYGVTASVARLRRERRQWFPVRFCAMAR
jgi:hypothetical protein